MEKFKDAIERIKILQCPTGDVENRVQEYLRIMEWQIKKK